MILSTTHELQGRTISDYLGIVVGESIMGTGVFRDIAAGLTDIIGSRSGAYEMKMQQARDMALQQMVYKAQALLANAVVGMDIDYEVVGDNMMMVSVSGTAVRIESTGKPGERASGPKTAT